jgi:hypothetical protein
MAGALKTDRFFFVSSDVVWLVAAIHLPPKVWIFPGQEMKGTAAAKCTCPAGAVKHPAQNEAPHFGGAFKLSLQKLPDLFGRKRFVR